MGARPWLRPSFLVRKKRDQEERGPGRTRVGLGNETKRKNNFAHHDKRPTLQRRHTGLLGRKGREVSQAG